MMRAFTATELLVTWEQGLPQPPALRALTLLRLAEPDSPIEQLARYSIGRRDARLWDVREAVFGSGISSQAECPTCGTRVEMAFTIEDLPLAPSSVAGELSLSTGDYEIQFRLPNSEDLRALPTATEPGLLRQQLLNRCILQALHKGEPVSNEVIPAGVGMAISERMAEADPQADVELLLTCPDCQHCWEAPLDIVSFLWCELHAWAIHMLRDVHTLATAYGWSEAHILGLSPGRRQAYLELNGS